MRPLERLSFSLRQYCFATVLIALLAALAAYAWVQLGVVGASAQAMGETRVPQLSRVSDIELNITRVSLQLRHAMLVKAPGDLGIAVADISSKRKHLDEVMNSYATTLASSGKGEAFRATERLYADFWTVAASNLALVREGRKDDALALLVEQTIPRRNELLAALAREKAEQNAALAADLTLVAANATHVRNGLVLLTCGTGVGALLFAWQFGRALTRRARTVSQVAESVRDGDLTHSVQDNGRDEFSPLLASLHEMQASLTRIVVGVRGNAESVATASAQIAQGNNDLSSRTEEQASALQETAASMKQLAVAVTANAASAQDGNALAREAAAVAQRSGAVVRDVVSTMNAIHEDSRRISEIIGTIDAIAFQTNILSLNAAVEAARAGDQGRGFAVVAAEVRALAQRSAEAAKQIKSLIDSSVQRVEQGNTQAELAGMTMSEVVGSIGRVHTLMGQISSSSSQQSAAVAQIESAVHQMDQVTQQNAALVEQSAAAAESLKHQARTLVDSVAFFRTMAAARAQQVRLPAPATAPRLATVSLTTSSLTSGAGLNDQWQTF